MLDIYSTRREILISTYQDESGERFGRVPSPCGKQDRVDKETWEYKWPGADEVYSNFSSDNMKDWKEGGFFGDGVWSEKWVRPMNGRVVSISISEYPFCILIVSSWLIVGSDI